jgi:hypothetical protein
MRRFVDTLAERFPLARRALTVASVCGGLLGGGMSVAIPLVTHHDAAQQTEAANRSAICPTVLQAVEAHRQLDDETVRVVRWCLDPIR